jgi:tetratricopeptide (TPR) repeat protein
MNRWRIGGLLVVAILAAWLVLRSCSPGEPEPQSAPPAPRDVFHTSKPLRVSVTTSPDAGGDAADLQWLEYELRQLLGRGQMRIAPIAAQPARDVFTLQVQLTPDRKQAALELIAPDRVVERRETLALDDQARLATISAFARKLPAFLNTAHTSGDWVGLIGTTDANAYDVFVNCSLEVFGPAAEGFTSPPAKQPARCIERLETLTRAAPKFGRAWGVLAVGYLSVGGKDAASLAQLAIASAERALAIDDDVAAAHAALGLVHLRRNSWVAALEQLERALVLDANSAPALEGTACLLVDAGRYVTAQGFAEQAVQLQPKNIGARECLEYSRTVAPVSSSHDADQQEPLPIAAARVQALTAILDGDTSTAQRLLRSALNPEDFRRWADPLLRAAADRNQVPRALRAITLAANEEQIDATTEIMCGAALRRGEFVFNRMARMQRQREHVPLRVLWLPQTAFLRKHARFEEIISNAGLSAFWQEHGVPYVCATEPAAYGCKVRTAASAKSKE